MSTLQLISRHARRHLRPYHGYSGLCRLPRWSSTAAPAYKERARLRPSSVTAELNSSLKVGHEIAGYQVMQMDKIPALEITAVLLEHLHSGAHHLHLAKDDPNNTFGVGFCTLPTSEYHDTGVAHILEHTVMCGSQKFPVRDPFFKMATRSLSSFMNAMTASDWTLYPFSSPNDKDFRNLLDVYLDLSFYPLLRELDFLQEGIRLQPTNFDKVTSGQQIPSSDAELEFKGVVFNEMKGVFSNPDNRFQRKLRNLILPEGPYSYESGGDPLAIPDLTWEMLRKFYATHYHPSNARFATYGNLPMENHLNFINDKVLSKTPERLTNLPSVAEQPRWREPRRHTLTARVDPLSPNPERQSVAAVSYLLKPVTDPYQSLLMHMVSELLISGPKAPFYQTLLQSGLGSDYAPGTGLDAYMKEAIFTVGLKQIAESSVDQVLSIINDTLRQAVNDGFDNERIEAILHHYELAQRHQSGAFGLHLIFGIMTPWIHQADPISFLDIDTTVARFRREWAENPHLLQDVIEQLLVNNPHRLTLEMHPDKDYGAKLAESEQKILAEKVAALGKADRERVVEVCAALKKEQDLKQDVSVLPTLTVDDIKQQCDSSDTIVASSDAAKAQAPLFLTDASTNGLVYFRSLLPTHTLPADLRPYVPLFANIVTEMGAGEYDYRALSQAIDLASGGFGVTPHILPHHSDVDVYEQGLVLSSYSLGKKHTSAMQLWQQILTKLRLDDREQFVNLVRLTAANLGSSLADSGHVFAILNASSRLREANALGEQWDGIEQVKLMRQLAAEIEQETAAGDAANGKMVEQTLNKMRRMADMLFQASPEARVSLHLRKSGGSIGEKGTSTDADQFIRDTNELMSSLPAKTAAGLHRNSDGNTTSFPHGESKSVYFEMPFDVHFAGRAFPTDVPYTHDDYAALRVFSKLVSFKFLHREVREKGGAYGSGCRVQSEGIVSFYSYRDPRSSATLKSFDDALDWSVKGKNSLGDENFTEADVDEAKLSIFSDVDKPVSAGSKGMRYFLYGIDDKMFQTHREALKRVTKADVVNVVEKYLVAKRDKAATTLLGPKNAQLVSDEAWTVVKDFGTE